MGKSYVAVADVTIPRVISNEDDLEVTESVNYPAGSLISEDDMTERDKGRASSGELGHLLREAGDDDQSRGDGQEPEFGVFVAEHEAEAHALEQYGHVVVPDDQALELGSKSAEYHAKYAEAVKEHGLDRRPAQEAMAQPRERVPDEVLQGAETRSGHPHDVAPPGFAASQESAGENSESEGDDSSSESPRQRPGSSQE